MQVSSQHLWMCFGWHLLLCQSPLRRLQTSSRLTLQCWSQCQGWRNWNLKVCSYRSPLSQINLVLLLKLFTLYYPENEDEEDDYGDDSEEDEEDSEEELNEVPVYTPTRPPYILIPPPPVWGQRNQGLSESVSIVMWWNVNRTLCCVVDYEHLGKWNMKYEFDDGIYFHFADITQGESLMIGRIWSVTPDFSRDNQLATSSASNHEFPIPVW